MILRTVWFPVSATQRLPLPSTATPWGPEKRAAEPVPSRLPLEPGIPATVVVTPVGVIFRMTWLEVSAT